MASSIIPMKAPRHDPTLALAWLDALEPVIRAGRLRTRKMGTEILVQALRVAGIQARTMSRAVRSSRAHHTSIACSSHTPGFIHLPCVEGQLFSFDGFEGEHAWQIALSNHHASQISKAGRTGSTGHLRHHTRYEPPGTPLLAPNPLEKPSRLDASGRYELSPADREIASMLTDALRRMRLPPEPIAPGDDRLEIATIGARTLGNPTATPCLLEEKIMQAWRSINPDALEVAASMAPQAALLARDCFVDAGLPAKILYRRLDYHGQREVFDITRLAIEVEIPAGQTILACLSAPGGWGAITDLERAQLQVEAGDWLYAHPPSPIHDIDRPALPGRVAACLASAFSSYLMDLNVGPSSRPAANPGPRL